MGINGAKGIVRSSPALSRRKAFTDLLNLRSIDVLAVRLYLDRKVTVRGLTVAAEVGGHVTRSGLTGLRWRGEVRYRQPGRWLSTPVLFQLAQPLNPEP